MKDMLKYQALDLEIKKLEKEILDNGDRQNAIKMQQYLKDCKEKLGGLEKKAKDICDAYAKYKDVYNKMAQNIELISKNASSEDSNKIIGLIEAGDSIVANLNKLDKEIKSIIASCDSVQNEYQSIMKNARTAKSNMEKYKDSFSATKENQEKIIIEKKKQLEELSKSVNKQMLAKYMQESKEKSKVFVPEVNGKCGGCRMEISAGKMNKLRSSNFIECENCGRIIYNDEGKK